MVSVPLLRSRLLPVPHGFTTREGGVSVGPYRSLNLGLSVGDERASVEENYRRLAAAAGVPLEAFETVSQVHGDQVLASRAEPRADGWAAPCGQADALWSARPGVAVGVRTADCVPLLLVDPDGRRVCAVHSGWKGTELKIAARAVETLARQGARPERLLAAVGPCIRACCYQVSDELAQRFALAFGEPVVHRGDRPRLDLPAAVKQTLADAGVLPAHIEVLEACTACDERFFSHRRDAGVTGRALSFAVCVF